MNQGKNVSLGRSPRKRIRHFFIIRHSIVPHAVTAGPVFWARRFLFFLLVMGTVQAAALSAADVYAGTLVRATGALRPATSDADGETENGQTVALSRATGGERALPALDWKLLRPGLELGLSILPETLAASRSAEAGDSSALVVLRIDPRLNSFSLSMASEGGKALSLADWSRNEGLIAGINAAMYLPDNRTSTGYMRNGEAVNNRNMGDRLGAFFVAERRKPKIPAADIIERGSPGWRERLEDYAIVVQNYRFISSDGRLLWPDGGFMHSMAVVGKDRTGRILFVLSQEPLSVERFAWYLANLPLELSTVMYVEGGQQAGLFVCPETPDTDPESEGKVKTGAAPSPAEQPAGASSHTVPGGTAHVWKGQSLLGARGNPHAALPNIIGVKR
jgi:hypothetical protein